MQPITTEEIVAYFAGQLSSDRARAIEELMKINAEFRARLWLNQASAGYCREDVSPARDERTSADSVTQLIRRVKEGDAAAGQDLLARYSSRLIAFARAKLRGLNLRIADEEDVAQSVLLDFYLGAERGQYSQCQDRDDLWHLLTKITEHKVQKLVREEEAQKRRSGPDQRDAPSKQIADPHPSPDLEISANDAIECFLQRLEDSELQKIAVWKWSGYTNEEIAQMLGCSVRTIQRKLSLIRTFWSQEEQPGTSPAP